MTTKNLKERLGHVLISRELTVEWRKPAIIRPDPDNPRLHPRDQIERLKRSIDEFGFTNPILVDENGIIICGHGRLLAARELGLGLVPVIVIAGLTEAQRVALRIADNALGEKSGWSKELLRSEIETIIDLGYDTELTGLDTVEIDSLLNFDGDEPGGGAGGAEGGEDYAPHDGPPLSRLGDHWVIGKHHFLVADARLRLSYELLLGTALVRCLFTDPPFNTPGSRISSKSGDFVMGSGELSAVEFERDLLRETFRNIVRVSLPGAIGFVCSDWRCLRPIWDAAEGVFVEPKNLCVWAKTNAGMGSFYRSQCEYVIPFLISKGETVNNMKLAPGKRHRSTLWTYPGANTFRRGRMEDLADHPAIKPRKLIADAILDVTKPGDIVLDPFLGSGTTLAACEVSGRIGYGLELDPKYADVILRRMAKQTGEVPHLIDGTPLAEVAAERQIEWEG